MCDLIEDDVFNLLNVLYPCELKNDFNSFNFFIKNYKEKNFVFYLKHVNNLKTTFREVINDFIIDEVKKTIVKEFANIDKNLLLEELKKSDVSVSDALAKTYSNQIFGGIERFKNNIICLIIFTAYFALNKKLKFSVFCAFIFSEVSKYNLDSNVQEVYNNVIKLNSN